MNSMKPLTAQTKAEILAFGNAAVSGELLRKGLVTTATAGPGAGGSSVFLYSGGHRVRLSVNPSGSLKILPLEGSDEVQVVHEGHILATGKLEQPLCHCPKQAYITISERCIFNCRFCPVPKIQGHIKTPEEIVSLVEDAAKSGNLRAISLTSGVAESPEKEAAYVSHIVRVLAKRFDLPIGVSVYPTDSSTEDLYSAGACEIKYNVETMDSEIFARVCPDLSLQQILSHLKGAVGVFGKNHVSSNFILGLGESDACVEKGVETLAGMGVIPNLRPISPHPLRKDEIVVRRPDAGRLVKLTRINRDALERHGLNLLSAKTMCLPCTGCDLTPYRDV